ncbi:MAG: hypothetical protein HS105_12205 [Chloracidobacterium sp.]|nr:hypothetical protein [Chloracidobacterium sp.]
MFDIGGTSVALNENEGCFSARFLRTTHVLFEGVYLTGPSLPVRSSATVSWVGMRSRGIVPDHMIVRQMPEADSLEAATVT